jgi:hypothetical protein
MKEVKNLVYREKSWTLRGHLKKYLELRGDRVLLGKILEFHDVDSIAMFGTLKSSRFPMQGSVEMGHSVVAGPMKKMPQMLKEKIGHLQHGAAHCRNSNDSAWTEVLETQIFMGVQAVKNLEAAIASNPSNENSARTESSRVKYLQGIWELGTPEAKQDFNALVARLKLSTNKSTIIKVKAYIKMGLRDNLTSFVG